MASHVRRIAKSLSQGRRSAPPLSFATFRIQQTQFFSSSAAAASSEESEPKEDALPRQRLSDVPVAEILKAKHSHRWFEPVIQKSATVKDAIAHTMEGGLSGMMVLEDRRVVGLITSRDLLRIMAKGIQEKESPNDILTHSITEFMTPISQVIYARPEETIGMCRRIMAKLGLKCLPVLSKGRVEGLITHRDMSEYGLDALDKGGKEAYLNTVSQRVGLSSNTSMADPPSFLRAHLALEQSPVYSTIGVSALPHPFKTHDGQAGRGLRDIRQSEYASDLSLSEDAGFVKSVALPDEQGVRQYTYLGVADGVGSWREYNVDPRNFSRRLMQECENILSEASHRNDSHSLRQVIAPAQLMAQAYERVMAENIIGSSTACIALFDGVRHQLHFSNLGDSGLVVLRHIDSDIAGALRRDRNTPRTERKSDLRLTFVSQQQLLKFNHPYQLGWIGQKIDEGESTSFKLPQDACTSSIHVRRGDIVVMATDGLFDNVDTDELVAICLEWEQRNGFIRGNDIMGRQRRWEEGVSLADVSKNRILDLAEALCRRARENSVNTEIDSPFAVLAKENDIMWNGGMPDDCTCVVLHITGEDGNSHHQDY